MELIKSKGLYERAPKILATGKIIGIRWVDIYKGDDHNPDYRSRRVAKEINRNKRLDLFAATPPLESMRYLLSTCARQNGAGRDDTRVIFNDVRRAYFFAEGKRKIYLSLPREDLEQHPGGGGPTKTLNVRNQGCGPKLGDGVQ